MPERLERCVRKVKASSAFAKTYRNRRNKRMTRTQLAWAICRRSLNI